MQSSKRSSRAPRGIYCGSIGRIDPMATPPSMSQSALLPCALNEDGFTGAWDRVSSRIPMRRRNGPNVWPRGILRKVERYGFDLIETMRFEPAQRDPPAGLHLERMKESAQLFGFEVRPARGVRNRLHAATFHLDSFRKSGCCVSKHRCGLRLRYASRCRIHYRSMARWRCSATGSISRISACTTKPPTAHFTMRRAKPRRLQTKCSSSMPTAV